MLALSLFVGTCVLAWIAEVILWRLFRKTATSVHFSAPLTPRFFHVATLSRMRILAAIHFLFVTGLIGLTYLALW